MNRQLLLAGAAILGVCACETPAPQKTPNGLIAKTRRVDASPETLLGRTPHRVVFQTLQRSPLDATTLTLYAQLSELLALQGKTRAALAVSAHATRQTETLPDHDPVRLAHDSRGDTWRWAQAKQWLETSSLCPGVPEHCRKLRALLPDPRPTQTARTLLEPRRSERVRQLLDHYNESPTPERRARLARVIAGELANVRDVTRRHNLWIEVLSHVKQAPDTWLLSIEQSLERVTRARRARLQATLCVHYERKAQTLKALSACQDALTSNASDDLVARLIRLEAHKGDLERALSLTQERDWGAGSVSLQQDSVQQRFARLREVATLALERGDEGATARALALLPATLPNLRFQLTLLQNPAMSSELRDKLLASPVATDDWSEVERLELEMERAHARLMLGKERNARRTWKKLTRKIAQRSDIDERRDLTCTLARLQHRRPDTQALAIQNLDRLLSSFPSQPESLHGLPSVSRRSYNLTDVRGLATSLSQHAGNAPLFAVALAQLKHPVDRHKFQSHALDRIDHLAVSEQRAILRTFVAAWGKETHSNPTISGAVYELSLHPSMSTPLFGTLLGTILGLEPEHLNRFGTRAWVRQSVALGHDDGAVRLLDRLGIEARRTTLRHALLQEFDTFSPGVQSALETRLYAWMTVHATRVSTRLRMIMASHLSERGDCVRAQSLLSSAHLEPDTLVVARMLPPMVRRCAARAPRKAWEMAGLHANPQTRATLYLELLAEHPGAFAQRAP